MYPLFNTYFYMKNNNKFSAGFALLPVLLVILALLVVGGGAYTYYNARQIAAPQTAVNQEVTTPVIATQTATNTPQKPVAKSNQPTDTGLSCVANGQTYPDGTSKSYTSSGGAMPITDLFHCRNGQWFDSQAPNDPTIFGEFPVTGMSQYTDASFGFSFWYPSSWTITYAQSTLYINHGTKSLMSIMTETPPNAVLTLPPQSQGADGSISFYFDKIAHQWMTAFGGSNPPAPTSSDVSNNTMGGLHIFTSQSVAIPLSAENFIVVPDYAVSLDPTPLIKTMVATDPAVATPVSAAEQQATIEAEKSAYAGQ
jgi:hypothetical protein